MSKEFTDVSLKEAIESSDDLIVVDFWASWCGPCRMLAPVIDQLIDENASINIGKLNIDQNPEMAVQFSVTSIPTILFIKNKEVVFRQRGVTSKAALQTLIDTHQ